MTDDSKLLTPGKSSLWRSRLRIPMSVEIRNIPQKLLPRQRLREVIPLHEVAPVGGDEVHHILRRVEIHGDVDRHDIRLQMNLPVAHVPRHFHPGGQFIHDRTIRNG